MSKPWDGEKTPATDSEEAKNCNDSNYSQVPSSFARDWERRARHAEARAKELYDAMVSLLNDGVMVGGSGPSDYPPEQYRHDSYMHEMAAANWKAHLAAAAQEDAR